MFDLLRIILVSTVVFASFAAQAKTKLEKNIQAFQNQPTPVHASKVGTQLLELSKTKNWKEITKLDSATVSNLLGVMPKKFIPELLLVTITANGIEKNDVERDRLIQLGESYAKEKMPVEQWQSFLINLGYVHIQIGEPETALIRLENMRSNLEANGETGQWMNLCGLSSHTFENYGNVKQAGQMYFDCDESSMIREPNLKGRGYFWHNYAMFLRTQGQFDKAVKRHHWSLNVLSAEYGFPSIQVVDAYDAMGQTLLAQGSYGAADSVAVLALNNSQKLDLKNKRSHWRLISNAAAIKRALRLPIQALALNNSAYQWRQKNLGERDQETLVSRMNLALDLIELERWDEAHAAMSEIRDLQDKGARFPWKKEIFDFYLAFIEAKKQFQAGKGFKISLKKIANSGAPRELIVSVAALYVEAYLSNGNNDKAMEMATWLKKFVHDNVGTDRPIYFEVDLLLAQAISSTSPKKGLEALKKLNLDLFNWNLGESMSGSYDAVVASRQLADDLLILMAKNAVKVPEMQPYVANVLNRWRTLDGASDKMLDDVSRTSPDPELRSLARTYLIDLHRFREHVRTKPLTDEVAQLDMALRQQRKALNGILQRDEHSIVHPPIKSIKTMEVETPTLKAGDVIIDLFFLRNWQQPDRTGYANKMELYGVVYKHNQPVRMFLVSSLDFAAKSSKDNYAELWVDFGTWVKKQVKGAKRVFIVPDSMMFQMDLASAAGAGGRRLGEIHDLYFLTERDAYQRHDIEQSLDTGDRVLLAGGLFYDEREKKDPSYLAGSLTEIDAIGTLVEKRGASVEKLIGTEATETVLKNRLPKAQVVHLATHGFFNDDDARPFSLQNAGIHLSYNKTTDAPNGDDGTAFASEVMDWKLADAELIVLSSCESGIANTTPVDAVRGLPLALSLAGARRSIVTLQKIPDKQTAAIMKRFYKKLTEQNMDYSRAFNETKRDVWAGRIDKVSPSVASAFVLYHH